MTTESNLLELIVSEMYAGQRADKVLGAICEELSRSRLKALIMQGQVSLNGEILKTPSLSVKEGDVFTVNVPEPVSSIPQAEDIPLDVVYEDGDLLVINKSAGMVVHPAAGNWSGTLVNALLHHCGDSLSGIGGVIRPGIVHRLDKGTSGLIMVAKNDHAHHSLSAQLADRSLSRMYHALVLGVPMPMKGRVERAIGRHRHNRLKMSVMSNSPKDAVTHYLVKKSFGEACSLVECHLETGRTHQIRVHLEAAGHPLVGDSLYGPQPTALRAKLKNERYSLELIEEALKFSRQALHAQELKCLHPVTAKEMVFTVNKPSDFTNLLNNLNKNG